MYCLEEALFLKELYITLPPCTQWKETVLYFNACIPNNLYIYFMHTTHIGHRVYNSYGILDCILTSSLNYNVIVFKILHYTDCVQGGRVIAPLKDPSLSPSSETR